MVQDNNDDDNSNDDDVTTTTNKSSNVEEKDDKNKLVKGSCGIGKDADNDKEVDHLAEAFQEKTKVTTTTTTSAESPNKEGEEVEKEQEGEKEAQQAPSTAEDAAAATVATAAAAAAASASDDGKNDIEDAAPDELQQVAEWIRSGQAQRILVVTGAGVSVAAGIPDFRSPGTGLYDNLKKYKLPYPEAVFDVRFFAQNPQPFVQLASELWPASAASASAAARGGGGASNAEQHHAKYKPTYTHCFLALLAEKNLLLRVYTQNIDGLDHMGKYV
jgi:Sir2 family